MSSITGVVGEAKLFAHTGTGIITDVTEHPHALSLSLWCISYADEPYRTLIRKGSNTSLTVSGHDAFITGRTYDGDEQARWLTPNGSLVEYIPTFVTVRFSETDSSAVVNAFLDGQRQTLAGNGFSTGVLNRTSHPFFIGNGLAGERGWDGVIDEVRISRVIRSAAWIRLVYENQRGNSVLLTLR
ncbi:MAG: hypothetical protein GF350_13475 [Chitinivibrionales bacterium]|nr:hypothetical protein [Chitinivibrionales bacterium]